MTQWMKPVSAWHARWRNSARRRPLRRPFFTLCLVVASVTSLVPRGAGATVIDLTQNFPNYQGENGFFAYGYAVATDSYQLLSGTGFFYRQVAGNPTHPQLFRTYEGYLGYPWMALFPSTTASPSGIAEDAVLAYTVPATATYQPTGSFYIAPQAASGIEAYIQYNTTIVWTSAPSASATQAFTVAASVLQAGDTIYFGVRAADASALTDASFLQGQIRVDPLIAVPAPNTVLLMGTGVVALAGSRRRWRRWTPSPGSSAETPDLAPPRLLNHPE